MSIRHDNQRKKEAMNTYMVRNNELILTRTPAVVLARRYDDTHCMLCDGPIEIHDGVVVHVGDTDPDVTAFDHEPVPVAS